MSSYFFLAAFLAAFFFAGICLVTTFRLQFTSIAGVKVVISKARAKIDERSAIAWKSRQTGVSRDHAAKPGGIETHASLVNVRRGTVHDSQNERGSERHGVRADNMQGGI